MNGEDEDKAVNTNMAEDTHIPLAAVVVNTPLVMVQNMDSDKYLLY